MLAAAALATSVVVIAPAGAAAPPQTCKSLTGSVLITPGLKVAPSGNQTATATGNLTGCAPAAKTGGSGVMKAKLTLPKNSSCAGLATGKQKLGLTTTITWKNKKTSTAALTATTGSGSTALIATISGKITKGLFVGRPVTTKIKVAQKAGEDCSAAHPVRHLTFKNTTPFVIH